MASRICFISTPSEASIYKELEIEFEYFTGFALSQKQRSINSMHKSINKMYSELKVLEISTKSTNPLGVSLSAFNLKFYDKVTNKEYPLENIFQSSKVFEKGGPYRDLLNVHPKDAKRDERLKTSGELTYFNYHGTIWDNEPKTMFYDWIYISALSRHEQLTKEILEYDTFTDIEFNHKKSINCQARAAAIFVSLSKLGKLEEALKDKDIFRKIYLDEKEKYNQMSLFDL